MGRVQLRRQSCQTSIAKVRRHRVRQPPQANVSKSISEDWIGVSS